MALQSNPIVLETGAQSELGVLQTTTTQLYETGTRGQSPDGRVYYFCRNETASALTRGQLLVAAAVVANHENLATITACLVAGSFVANDVTLGATAATANQYANGYLVVTDGGGEGQTFTIDNHAAIASAGTGDFVLKEAVEVASDANTTVSLVKNLYHNPLVSVTDQLDVTVGVPNVTIPAGNTTVQYGWVQTWGPCAVLCDEAVTTVGQAVVTGTGVAGAVEEDDTATTVSQEPLVGYNLTPLVDTEYQFVDLRIRP